MIKNGKNLKMGILPHFTLQDCKRRRESGPTAARNSCAKKCDNMDQNDMRMFSTTVNCARHESARHVQRPVKKSSDRQNNVGSQMAESL